MFLVNNQKKGYYICVNYLMIEVLFKYSVYLQ